MRSVLASVLVLVAASPVFAQQPAAAGQTATGLPRSTPAALDSTVAPARENYKIGVGDVLKIRVLGEEQLTSPAVRVREDGTIQSPFVDDDIQAQCLTERELSDVIATKLKKYLKFPEVHVAVKEYNSIPAAVIGAVNQPGRFKMQRRVGLLELLTFAGGVKTEAGKVVHLVHMRADVACENPQPPAATENADEGASTETVSLSKLLDGDLTQDRVVRPGDIVIVPNADLIFIAGEVLKPNAYPLREGMTLTQALAVAGGPSPVAKPSQIRIVRQEPGKPHLEIPVDLKAVQANKMPDPVLVANDLIEVPSSAGKTFFRNFVGALGGAAAQLPVRAVP